VWALQQVIPIERKKKTKTKAKTKGKKKSPTKAKKKKKKYVDDDEAEESDDDRLPPTVYVDCIGRRHHLSLPALYLVFIVFIYLLFVFFILIIVLWQWWRRVTCRSRPRLGGASSAAAPPRPPSTAPYSWAAAPKYVPFSALFFNYKINYIFIYIVIITYLLLY
jgi:hypothetical protein